MKKFDARKKNGAARRVFYEIPATSSCMRARALLNAAIAALNTGVKRGLDFRARARDPCYLVIGTRIVLSLRERLIVI